MGFLQQLSQCSCLKSFCSLLPNADLRCNVESPLTLPFCSADVQDGENSKYAKAENNFWNWSIWDADKQLALDIYTFASKKKYRAILATFFGYTCDECIWVILPVLLASLYSLQFGTFEVFREMPCVLELLLDLFGAVVSSGFVEQILKTTFKRTRPTFVAQRTEGPWCVYGEWWSFPSGHTMRAFYLHQWILHSSIVQAFTDIRFAEIPWVSPVLLLWCFACGWARVAAGRHFPSDVTAGAICGFIVGHIVETVLTSEQRYAFKSFAGVVVASQAWFYLLQPILTQAGLKRNAVLFIRVCFFAFYLKALFSAVVLPIYYITQFPDEELTLGEFSYYNEGDRYVCNSYW